MRLFFYIKDAFVPEAKMINYETVRSYKELFRSWDAIDDRFAIGPKPALTIESLARPMAEGINLWHSRRRLHLGEPGHCACYVDEGLERRDGLLATQGDPAEALDAIEKALDEMALLVECPVDCFRAGSGRVLLDLRGCSKVFGDEGPEVVGVVGCVGDDMTDAFEAFDQPAGLRAVAAMTGRDLDADRQPERIHGGMDLRGQAASGAADPASFKPPF